MRLIQHITEPGPLRDLARAWPINPVTAEVANDPAIRAANPLMMSNHQDRGLAIDTDRPASAPLQTAAAQAEVAAAFFKGIR